MRRVVYSVAMRLDGFIGGPEGQYDWIVQDPAIDFGAYFARFDAVLMGRRTFEVASNAPEPLFPGLHAYVFSKTMPSAERPNLTIVADQTALFVKSLREQAGKEIWLMGGGIHFRDLFEAGQVDSVEVAIIPILLGGGIPLLPQASLPIPLEFRSTERYPSGIVSLVYRVRRDAPTE